MYWVIYYKEKHTAGSRTLEDWDKEAQIPNLKGGEGWECDSIWNIFRFQVSISQHLWDSAEICNLLCKISDLSVEELWVTAAEINWTFNFVSLSFSGCGKC